jgi:hypothetical protein
MRVAILHYHLRTGGVSTVIRHQTEALRRRHRLVVLTGEKPPSPWPLPTVVVPGIGYDGEAGDPTPPREAAEAILRALDRHLGGACDLIHVHNPTLAKNRGFLRILQHLQDSGQRLFLQIHDLAEDGRPGAYFAEDPYPADCHYGVINRRDLDHLRQAGLSPPGLHFLPNAVEPLGLAPDPPATGGVLYPVRAIRRKNIGEAILASLFWKDGTPLDITLPPRSPADVPPYLLWKDAVRRLRLAVTFETGQDRPFNRVVAEAGGVITTSVSEGFGFVFLEPWTAGRLLWGRALPYICDELTADGMRLGHLYTAVRIPLEWVGRDRLREQVGTAWERSREAFRQKPAPGEKEAFLAPLDQWPHVDFGLLNEACQLAIIERVHRHPRDRQQLARLNPRLARAGKIPGADRTIAVNRRVVESRYGLPAYARRLEAVYAGVRDTPVSQRIDKARLLKACLRLDQFSLLKWGAPTP